MLAQHPEVWAPEPKEPGFFSLTDEITPRGIARYTAPYAGAGDRRWVLDGSTSYAQTVRYPHTIDRIRHHCGGDLHFLYLVREPVERIRSAYVQLRSEGLNDLPRDLGAALPRLIEPTWYHTHWSAYADAFGAERIFVATFEELVADPAAVTARCLDFLGVEQRPLEPVHANVSVDRIQNPPVLDRLLGFAPVRRLAAAVRGSRLESVATGLRARLAQPVDKPELTPAELGEAWPRLRDEALAILEIAGDTPERWPSLAS
ncbi:MAG: hypothetical protein D6683_02315 [Actinomyces sp.]|nr:MAG: hypothetical protein D6683_02315 [Actinomyces sp.]